MAVDMVGFPFDRQIGQPDGLGKNSQILESDRH
jgi:hypothetical protein